MWKKKYFFLIIFFGIINLGKAQTAPQLINEIPVFAKSIQIDQLQQLYIIKADNALLKFDAKGEQQFEYSNSLLSELTFVDVTDPLNITLYYADYQSIVLLDRSLTELKIISLFELGFGQISAIALSNNQNIWLYDESDFKLKKINRHGKVVFESGDLSLGIDKLIQPTQLIERNNKIFANDPNQGIFVFDLFGQYLYHLAIKNLSHFQIFNNRLIYFADHQLKSWNLQSKLEQNLMQWKKQTKIRQVLVDQNNRLYLLKADGIEIYEAKK